VLSWIVDQIADKVTGQQVGRKLDAGELRVNALGQGTDGRGLRQTRHTFQEHMSIGEETDEKAFNEMSLADDRLRDLRFDAVNRWMHGLDLGLEVFKFGGH
jgi:hypothetical protein